jgi:hypothetical protein
VGVLDELDRQSQGGSVLALLDSAPAPTNRAGLSSTAANTVMNTAVPGVFGGMAPNAIPGALATLASSIPGPAQIPAVAAARGGGEVLRQGLGMIAGQEPSLGQIGQEAKQGAIQGATGYGLQKAVGLAASPFSSKLMSRLSAQLERKAVSVNKVINTDELLRRLKPLEMNAARRGPKALAQHQDFVDEFLGGNGPRATMQDVLHIKQVADNEARAVHEARAARVFVGPAEKVAAQRWAAISDAARETLKKEVPGARKLLGQMRNLIRVRGAVTHPAVRTAVGSIAAGAVLPHSIPWQGRYLAGAAAGAGLMHPAVLQLLANGALGPTGQLLLQQLGSQGASLVQGQGGQ